MEQKTRKLTVTALFAALLCILSPWCISVGPVPISLASFAVMLTGASLGSKRGTLAVAVYLLLGVLGLPVFSGFTGGAQQLIGVTGGYLWGYLPCAFCTGLFADRFSSLLFRMSGMLLGTVILYAVGTAYFCFLTKTAVAAAGLICVLPFLPGDALKIICAGLLCGKLRTVAMKEEERCRWKR